MSRMKHQGAILTTALSVVLSAVALGEARQRSELAGQTGSYVPPIVDLTTARGILHPNGEQQAQTVTVVEPGRASSAKIPSCLGSGVSSAGATCVNLCVRMPAGSTLSKVEGLAADFDYSRAGPWLPCGSETCLKQRPENARAMFDAAGYVLDRVSGQERVCWVFRNWHSDLKRTAVLLLTFRSPRR